MLGFTCLSVVDTSPRPCSLVKDFGSRNGRSWVAFVTKSFFKKSVVEIKFPICYFSTMLCESVAPVPSQGRRRVVVARQLDVQKNRLLS